MVSERVSDLVPSLIMNGQTDAFSPAVFFLIHVNEGGKYSPLFRAGQPLPFKRLLCLSHHSSFGTSESMLGRFPYNLVVI